MTILLHRPLNQYMHIKQVQNQTHKQQVQREQIQHASPEVTQVEMVKPWEEERQKPHHIPIHIVSRQRSAIVDVIFALLTAQVVLVRTDLLQKHLLNIKHIP